MTTKISNNAYQLFDYIMNTQPAYNKLGEAIVLARKRAARYHIPILDELKETLGVKSVHKKWARTLLDAVRIAKKDFIKNFPEESQDGLPEWLEAEWRGWYPSISVVDVLRIAVTNHGDRWVL